MQFSSIWPIDKTLSGATTQAHSGPWSNGNEGVHRIPQSSSITEASPSDCLVSYPGHSLGESYPSAEIQSVYSTGPANWACGVKGAKGLRKTGEMREKGIAWGKNRKGVCEKQYEKRIKDNNRSFFAWFSFILK